MRDNASRRQREVDCLPDRGTHYRLAAQILVQTDRRPPKSPDAWRSLMRNNSRQPALFRSPRPYQ